MQRILIVEDEEAIAEGVAYNLRREGFDVRVAVDGPSGLSMIESGWPTLVLLDLMLPGMGGMEVCRRARQRSNVPILMLTAKNTETDKVVGLSVGADDFVTKPFSIAELVARIHAILRRAQSAEVAPEVLSHGDLLMDLGRHVVTLKDKQIQLSPKEFDLLRALMENRGRVLTRQLLLDRVWGEDTYIDSKTVDVHVRWLRQKVEEDPSHPRFIQTVRSVGYRFGD
ncbi:MAG TPA: response regulator transcription factor [Armatimonadota bacterium]|jgi:DNA-binding response OmpR family regulator